MTSDKSCNVEAFTSLDIRASTKIVWLTWTGHCRICFADCTPDSLAACSLCQAPNFLPSTPKQLALGLSMLM